MSISISVSMNSLKMSSNSRSYSPYIKVNVQHYWLGVITWYIPDMLM